MAEEKFEKFNVGGVVLDRPFKIRRLGHFGFNMTNMEEGRHFYVDLLGFKVSDVMDYSKRAKSPEQVAGLGDPNGYFTRYGTDHHSMVLFPKRVRDALGRAEAPGVTVNQITWQVGSMSEVSNAIKWFDANGIKQQRSGRDMPGSNWHTYLLDPDGQSNELYYGIEQIGWNGHSKPRSMYDRAFDKPPAIAADLGVRGGRARPRRRHRSHQRLSPCRQFDRPATMSTASSCRARSRSFAWARSICLPRTWPPRRLFTASAWVLRSPRK